MPREIDCPDGCRQGWLLNSNPPELCPTCDGGKITVYTQAEMDRFLGAVKQHLGCLESRAALAVVQNAVNYYDEQTLKE